MYTATHVSIRVGIPTGRASAGGSLAGWAAAGGRWTRDPQRRRSRRGARRSGQQFLELERRACTVDHGSLAGAFARSCVPVWGVGCTADAGWGQETSHRCARSHALLSVNVRSPPAQSRAQCSTWSTTGAGQTLVGMLIRRTRRKSTPLAWMRWLKRASSCAFAPASHLRLSLL